MTALYVLACIVVPALWGWASFRVFRWLEARRRAVRPSELPPIDYSI
jgi:hypothetical protein